MFSVAVSAAHTGRGSRPHQGLGIKVQGGRSQASLVSAILWPGLPTPKPDKVHAHQPRPAPLARWPHVHLPVLLVSVVHATFPKDKDVLYFGYITGACSLVDLAHILVVNVVPGREGATSTLTPEAHAVAPRAGRGA